MPYTDSSGVQIPTGTDAFNPTAQFVTWQDKNATYNNRVIVALDTDRTALATPTLREGLLCHVEATNLEWRYTDSTWQRTDNSPLLVSETFTGAASVSVDDLTGYDRYRVVVSIPTTSTALNLSVRLRSGGADNSSAVYDVQSISAAATTVTGVEVVSQTSWASLAVGSRSIHSMEIELDGLSLAQQTVADIRVRSANASANLGQMVTAARHRTGSAFDGLSVIASAGTMTGTIKVYGYA